MTLGNITITTPSGPREFRLMGPMALGGGNPMWNVIERAKRQPITSWNGRELFAVELPILLDGWAARTSVEASLSFLRRLLVAANDKGLDQGLVVNINGTGLMEIPRRDIRTMDFVAVELGVDNDSVIRADDGTLLRVIVTLTLQEYVASPDVSVHSSLTNAAASKRVIRVMVRKGDTYASISSRPGIPKAYRAKVKAFFTKHPETRGGPAKLRKRAGKIYSVPV